MSKHCSRHIDLSHEKSGLCYQHKEIGSYASAGNRVLGTGDKFCRHDIDSARAESHQAHYSVPRSCGDTSNYLVETHKFGRFSKLYGTSSTAGSPPVSMLATAANVCFENEDVLSKSSETESKLPGGAPLVGKQPTSVKWKVPTFPEVTSCVANRCIQERLGSILQGTACKGAVESSRINLSHKLPRIESSLFGSSDICQNVQLQGSSCPN